MARASRRLKKEQPSAPVEPTRARQLFRPALAQYLRDAAAAIEYVNVFTLRGNYKWSLNYELQMNTREYSALLGSELIKLKADGNVGVRSKEWDTFLHGYNLRDMNSGEGSVCEFTISEIKYASMTKGPIDGKGRLHILRIGEGDPVLATERINNGDNPPRFGRTISSAILCRQRRIVKTTTQQ